MVYADKVGTCWNTFGKIEQLTGGSNAGGVVDACIGGSGASDGDEGSEAFACVAATFLSGKASSNFDTIIVAFD